MSFILLAQTAGLELLHLLQSWSSSLSRTSELLNACWLIICCLIFHFSLQLLGMHRIKVDSRGSSGSCRKSHENICHSGNWRRALRGTGELGRLVKMPIIPAMQGRSQKYLLLSPSIQGWKCPIAREDRASLDSSTKTGWMKFSVCLLRRTTVTEQSITLSNHK